MATNTIFAIVCVQGGCWQIWSHMTLYQTRLLRMLIMLRHSSQMLLKFLKSLTYTLQAVILALALAKL